MRLTEDDAHTAVWKNLREYYEGRRQLLMEKNNTSKSTEETEKLRGRIAECDHILSLDKPSPEIESDDPGSY